MHTALVPLLIAALLPLQACTAPAPTADEPAETTAVADNEWPEDFRISSFRWDGPIQAGDRVEIRNPYGDIRCRRSGTGELTVAAQIQTFTNWQPAPELEVHQADGQFRIRVAHEHPQRVSPGGDYDNGFAGRIDVTLLIPNGTTLEAATLDGAIRVKGFDGHLIAATDSGEVQYAGKGAFDLRSGSGNFLVTPRDFDAGDPADVHTESGSVKLLLPHSAAVVVAAAAPAGVETQLPDKLNALEKRDIDKVELRMNGGGRLINVGSASGKIVIHAQ